MALIPRKQNCEKNLKSFCECKLKKTAEDARNFEGSWNQSRIFSKKAD